MNEQRPLPYPEATRSLRDCVATSGRLLIDRRVHLPRQHLGMQLRFADGTSARVFRETIVDRPATANPCALIVGFRLRLLRGRAHELFYKESLLNTPLFVGFPGFVSKLWLANDERDLYRGVYEWDGPERAEHYARSLWRVLELGCLPSSIHYQVLPGLTRQELLNDPQRLGVLEERRQAAWWRLLQAA